MTEPRVSSSRGHKCVWFLSNSQTLNQQRVAEFSSGGDVAANSISLTVFDARRSLIFIVIPLPLAPFPRLVIGLASARVGAAAPSGGDGGGDGGLGDDGGRDGSGSRAGMKLPPKRNSNAVQRS